MNVATLIVVLSETRAYKTTYERFEKNLLDIFEADLALCVSNNDREDKNNPFYKKAKYIWESVEYEDWGDGIENLVQDIHPEWRNFIEVRDQWLGGVYGDDPHPGSAAILIYFREFLKKNLVDSGVLEGYQRIIITRSDYTYETPHVPPRFLDNRYIWIPEGEHYGGFTDRHIVCPTNKVIQVLSLTDIFKTNPKPLIEEMKRRSVRWNLETYLKFHFERKGLISSVKEYPHTMYTVREVEGHTRWSYGKFDSRKNLYIKYRWEYWRHVLAKVILFGGEWSKFKISVFNFLYRFFYRQRYMYFFLKAWGIKARVYSRKLARPNRKVL